jgi:hypothetical protein
VDSISITVDDVLAFNPCPQYTRTRVEQLFAGRATINLTDILQLDIPPSHKMSVLLRAKVVPLEMQQSLKEFYLSRIDQNAAPHLWELAAKSDCATAGEYGQRYAALHEDKSAVTTETREAEASLQLAKIVEVMSG